MFACFYQYKNHQSNQMLPTGPSKLLRIWHSFVFMNSLSTGTLAGRGATSTSAVDKLSVRTQTGCGSTHKVVPLVLTQPGQDCIKRETPPQDTVALCRPKFFFFFPGLMDSVLSFFCSAILSLVVTAQPQPVLISSGI